VIATSKHALLSHPPLDAPLYVVGEQTAEAALTHGWPKACHIATNSSALIDALDFDIGAKLLYVRGETVSADLPAALAHCEWVEVITYHAKAVALSEHIIEAIKTREITHVALYSRRTARLFEQQLIACGAPASLKALCLSDAVAQSLSPKHWLQIEAAPEASHLAMRSYLMNAYKSDAIL